METPKILQMSNPYITNPWFNTPDKNDPDWHKKVIGGMWDELGKLQFDFFKKQGLKNSHYLLDVGCGSLRGGVHFINYLKPQHYYGIDLLEPLLDAGKIEIQKLKLTKKKPILKQLDNFEFSKLRKKFDFAIAQSVFTHLPLNDIIICLTRIEKALCKNGKFYATFFENKKDKGDLKPITRTEKGGRKFTTFFDKDPYHYSFEAMKWACKDLHIKPIYIGDWKHPRHKKMLLFQKT